MRVCGLNWEAPNANKIRENRSVRIGQVEFVSLRRQTKHTPSTLPRTLSVVLARPISAGGDTDTIASLTGQLAGTVVRATGVSHDLFGGVEGSEESFQIAGRFAKFVSARKK